MDPPPATIVHTELEENTNKQTQNLSRNQSFSQGSDDSQTAAEFIDSQLQLEADAREALPYKFEECTRPIGKLRQVLFSCLTCNPPPARPTDPYNAAGVCYSCSIQCHGEHTLVELFNKRDFTCDCGTTRLPTTSPCTLRLNAETNMKGGVHSEEPSPDNKYNQNFRNRFCGCECDYEADKQKGTMFQCLGLGTAETGGCGEDWWHSGCVVGLGPDWYELSHNKPTKKPENEALLESRAEVAEASINERNAEAGVDHPSNESIVPANTSPTDANDDDLPAPPGFPEEDAFEGFICYKCVDANPWIKRYAGTAGFLAPVFRRSAAPSPENGLLGKITDSLIPDVSNSKKRKSEDDAESNLSAPTKRLKDDASNSAITNSADSNNNGELAVNALSDDKTSCRYKSLPPEPTGQFSLFFNENFRNNLCRCAACFPELKKHEQLLEEEQVYEPALSLSDEEAGGSTIGSGSIYDRGESALKNIDRVKAIEGVMAYNHLKDKLQPFFKKFAESGEAISAEDVKAHFAQMRGDEQAIKDAAAGAKAGDNRKEQSGY